MTPDPDVTGVAWSPAGGAADGGCLLATLTSDGRVVVLAPPPGAARDWVPIHDATDDMMNALEEGGWPSPAGRETGGDETHRAGATVVLQARSFRRQGGRP